MRAAGMIMDVRRSRCPHPAPTTVSRRATARVRQSNIYPGVDLVYHGDNSGLEYDFVVAPGADPKRIRLSFSGMQKIVIDPSGDLRLHTEYGELTQHKPIVYQTVDGERRFISGAFERVGKTLVGFRIGTYDHAKELVIDPAVEYATYFGGSSSDSGAKRQAWRCAILGGCEFAAFVI